MLKFTNKVVNVDMSPADPGDVMPDVNDEPRQRGGTCTAPSPGPKCGSLAIMVDCCERAGGRD